MTRALKGGLIALITFLCLFGGMSAVVAQTTPGLWVNLQVPGPNLTSMGDYDKNRQKAVLFGGNYPSSGSSPNVSADTWEWDGSSWQKIPVSGPYKRGSSNPLAFDSARGEMVLHGGSTVPDNYLDDTWTYNGVQWTLKGYGGPGRRANHAVAYDAIRQKVVLFGGSYYQTIYRDTWEWDGSQWTRVSTTGPSPRIWATMAYDHARGKMVLFGGQSHYSGPYLNDTWEWDGTSWRLVANTGPSPRSCTMMAFDHNLQKVVLFGGSNQVWPTPWPPRTFNDTWVWDGVSWTQIPISGPPGRYRASMFYDSKRGNIILFGGNNENYENPPCNDTWELRTAPANQPPTANAGPDQTVHAGLTVNLDGSGSGDPDGNLPLTYAWEFTAKPPGSTATLSDSGVVNPSFVADVPGNYELKLTVTDSLGLVGATDPVAISTTNVAPVAAAGPDQAISFIGSTVYLNALTPGEMSYDLDGDPLTFQWTLSKPEGSATTLVGADTATPSFMADVHGSYEAQLVVSDPWSSSMPDQVRVSFTNIQPVANAGPSQSVMVGDTVTLAGSGNDANGAPLTYLWSFVTKPEGSTAAIVSPTMTQTTFVPDLPGTYVVQLVANDGLVNSEPSTAQIQVTAGGWQMVITRLQDLNAVIGNTTLVPNSAFKNANMRNTLINKLNAVIANLEGGKYADALGQLQHDILAKTDGCAQANAPDKNDWIQDCTAQGLIYPELLEIIVMVQNLM